MDFGIIVDGAVIVVENVFRRLGDLKDKSNKTALRNAIELATVEVGRPTFFSMLIIIAAHHSHLHSSTPRRPHLRAYGLDCHQRARGFVAPFDHARSPVMLPSPAQNIPHQENAVVRFFQKALPRRSSLGVGSSQIGHHRGVDWVHRESGHGPRLGTEFLPELNEGSIWVNANLPPGISVRTSQDLPVPGFARPSVARRKCARSFPKPAGLKTAPIPSPSIWPRFLWI